MRFSILILYAALAGTTVADAQTSGTKRDPVTECFRTYFPIALGMPMSAVPSEVRFYCAAPWNLQAFESVRKALDNSRFDVAGSASRMTSGLKAKMVLQTLPMAISAADNGPPGMGAVYLTYHVLPLAYALHKGTSDAAVIEKAMDKQDAAKLRAAAAAIDWKLTVVANVKDFPATAPVSANATLGDLPMGILKHSQSKASN